MQILSKKINQRRLESVKNFSKESTTLQAVKNLFLSNKTQSYAPTGKNKNENASVSARKIATKNIRCKTRERTRSSQASKRMSEIARESKTQIARRRARPKNSNAPHRLAARARKNVQAPPARSRARACGRPGRVRRRRPAGACARAEPPRAEPALERD